jgi:two-component system sensor histidine kinase/response regulator
MQPVAAAAGDGRALLVRTEHLFTGHQQAVYKQTDRTFAVLMAIQWLAGIAAAYWISPKAWAGQSSHIHPHVWAALFLGGAICGLPFFLASTRPGEALTRYTIAIGQMLMGALLIHLSGGRIETHFHVFGSLAFLSFYRDWRVLVPATIVVAADHLLRGIFWPESVYGVLAVSSWRWLEHAGWVAFEDIFLVLACIRSKREIREISRRTAESQDANELLGIELRKRKSAEEGLRAARDELEARVVRRTADFQNEIAERKLAVELLRRSEEHFRSLIENASDIITVLDLDGTIRYESPAVQRVLGYKPEGMIGKNVDEFSHPDDVNATSLLSAGVGEPGNGPVSRELRFKHQDGGWRTLEVFGRLLRDETGAAQVIVNSRDITDRNRAAETLKESETLFRSLAETVSAAIYIYRDSKFVYVNPAAETITGYTHDELMGMEVWDLLHPNFLVEAKERAALRQKGEDVSEHSETKILAKNGEPRWLDITPRLIRFQGKQAVLATAFDITERKGWEDALRQSEEKYRTILQSIQEGYYEVDLTGNLTFFNDSLSRIVGTSPDKLMGLNNREYTDAETARRLYAAFHQVFRSGDPLEEFQYQIVTRGGVQKFLETSILLRLDQSGEISGFRGTVRDITERKQADIALRESGERYRLLFESNPQPMWVYDLETLSFLAVNEAAIHHYGYSRDEFLAMTIRDIRPPEDIPILLDAISQVDGESELMASSWRHCRKDGTIIDVEITSHTLDFSGRRAELVLATDITERKRAEQAVRESEARYKTLFEAATDAIMILDTEGGGAGRIVAANRAAAETTGYTVDELLNLNVAELRVDEQSDRVFRDIECALGGSTTTIEISRRRKDGSTFPVEVNSSPVRLGDKQYILVFVRDMTQRKRMEKEATMLAHTVRSIQECVSITDTEHRVVFVNDAFVKTYGLERDEVLGKKLIDLVRVKSESTDSPNELAGPGPAQAWEGELLNRRKDGTVFPINLCVSPIHDDSGRTIALAGIAQDITERKKIVKEVSMLAHAIRSIHEAVVVTDPDGNIIFVNNAAVEMFGYGPDEAIGKPVSILHSKRSSPDFVNEVVSSARVDRWEGEILSQRKDGTEFSIYLSASDVKDENGQCIALIGVSQDITERKRSIAELQKAKEAAEAASRAKSEFLANMSHEIRTPMNGIVGMTELALDTELSDEQREYLQLVKLSADSLLRVINDILDFSKIEAGKLELDFNEFSLQDSVDQVMKALAVRADQKGLELAYYLRPGVPDLIVGDGGRLRQILVNLVGNAIKFTEHGEVVVRVETESRSDDQLVLHFCVRDTGIGVPIEKQALIFESFTQADGSTTRKYGGTGLGLAISTQLVYAMDGQIWIESPSDCALSNSDFGLEKYPSNPDFTMRNPDSTIGGAGSIFHFTAAFALPRTRAARTAPLETSTLRGLPALVVDDNATNRRILEVQLAGWGMKPTMAANAAEALNAVHRAAADGAPFRLVLVDFHMPNVDGLELTEQIRRIPEAAGVKIIIMSSAVRENYSLQDRGIDAYLLKPVRASELLDVIRTVLGKTSLSQDSSKRPLAASSAHPVRVLVAEDNPVNQALIKRLLTKWGHTVVIAQDGKQALSLLEIEKFDVILMDLQMPEINGFEATTAIREKERATGNHVLIIALTAHALKGDRERCIDAGMDEYVAKPIDAHKLFEVLESAAARAVTTGNNGRPHVPAFDGGVVLKNFDGDVELVRKLADIFAESSAVQLSEIREAVARGDSQTVEFASHSLKGAVANFRARAAVDAAASLEKMGRGRDLSYADAAFGILETEVERLKHELAEFCRTDFSLLDGAD